MPLDRHPIFYARVIAMYLTYIHCAMKNDYLFYCMDVLHKATVYPLPRHLIENYEAIDVLICKLMDEAKGNLQKIIYWINSVVSSI